MRSHEREVVPITRPIGVKETQLIDRADEMRLLREAVDRAVRGEGGVVFLYGEAGIGKTRLTRELAAYASLLGMRVLSGRCPALFRMDGVPPYILWKEVVKDYLETCTSDQLYKVIGNYPIEVSKLVPELKQMLRNMPESFPLSPDNSRDRLFEAVSQFITNISKETPLLVILDDLQWVDESSLLLLHYLARGTYKDSLLLLGAYRDTDVDEKHPLIPVLTELNRERLLQSVQLKRMSFDDSSEMIKRILEQDDISREFCELIYDRTRGNPFFVEEVIKSLKEEEVIYREDDKWKIKEVSKIEFPETVKSVIKKRVSRLNDECQSILTLASFVGNDFTFEAISGVTGTEESKLLELMERLLKTGLVKERVIRGEDVYCFIDVIVRDVVHEEVSHLRHKKLHSSVGNALEKVYVKKIEEHLGELAYHFLEGGEKDKALDYFLKAGENAIKIYANTEAISYFQSALKLLEEREGEYREKAHVLESLGDLKRIVGEYDLCMKRWNEALLLRKQLDEKEKVAGLHRKMATTLWRDIGNSEKAQENFEKALQILEAEPENVELAALYAARAHMSYFTEDVTKARSWAEKALELAKKLNAFEAMASSYVDLGLVFNATGEQKKATECMEKALKIALDNGYADVAGRALNNLAVTLPAGENERILDCFEKGLEVAKKIGLIEGTAWFESQLATTYFGMGNSEKALTLAEESDALNRKTGNLFNLSSSTLYLGAIYHALGELTKGEQYLKESLNISLKINNTQQIQNSYGFLGFCYHDRREYVQAKEYFEKMIDALEKTGAKAYQISSYQWPAMNYIELGEIDKARTLLDDLHKFAHEKQNKQLIADEDATRAMLLRAEKKWSESIELFEKSLQEYEALGARQWNVYFLAKYILYEYARTYLERDQPGDREKADKLLNQALEIYQKLGAKKDIEKTEAKMIYAETGQQLVSQPKPTMEVSKGFVATGYADLDNSLFGGIPKNYAVILTSRSCDERNLLIKSFLEAGARKGEVTYYVTINPGMAKTLAEELQSNFYLFVCNPQADAIVRSQPNIFKLKGVESLTDIGIALTSAIRKLDPSLKGSRRVCIDLVSDILLQHHAVQTRRWLAGLVPELRSGGFTTLAVMDPEMHAPQEVRAVLDLFEGEIDIREKETEKGFGKHLRIKRMTNQKYLENELLLKKEG